MGVQDILVVGGGAIGALYGWRLASGDNGNEPPPRVTVVCRSNYESVKKSGFKIQSVSWGEGTFVPHHVANDVAHVSKTAACGDLDWHGWDYIIVCTKAILGASSVVDSLQNAVQATIGQRAGKGSGSSSSLNDEPAVMTPTLVVIQNGIGVEKPLYERYPNCPLISVVAFVGVTAKEPSIVTHVGQGGLLLSLHRPLLAANNGNAAGECAFSNNAASAAAERSLQRLVALLVAGGVQTKAVPSQLMHTIRLHKLIWSAAMPPACVLSRADRVMTLLDDADATELVRLVMDELWDVCAAELGREPYSSSTRGRPDRKALSAWQASVFPPDVVPNSTDQFMSYSRDFGNHPPSLLVDFNRGRGCEVDVTIGAAIELAKKHGVHTPHLDTFYLLLRSAVRNRKL